MKICLLSDLHLFSNEIGGSWAEDSFKIFQEELLPKVAEEKPDLIFFLGDILDPLSGKRTPRWPSGDEINERFVSALATMNLNNLYSLRGNHDYFEPLQNIEMMGGPKLVKDEWLKVEDNAFYFFSTRYPNPEKAEKDLGNIPEIRAAHKFLLMHETVNIPGEKRLSNTILKRISDRFEFIFNGHEHAYSKAFENIYCLSSALPWRPKYDSNNYEITWDTNEKEPNFIERGSNIHGFYLFDTENNELEFLPISRDVKIATAQLNFKNIPATNVRDKLIKLSDVLKRHVEQNRTVVRVYLQGTLREGDERIDIGLTDIEREYYGGFYEGYSKKVIHATDLQGGGSYLDKEDLKYLSVEDALDQLEKEIPEIRGFYEEISDLIERKTFKGDQLIKRIEEIELFDEEENAK